MYGLTDDEITAIREGKFEGFPAPELSLLRMADAMADTPSNVSDELYSELRRHFSEEQLIELAAAQPGKTTGRATTVCSTWEATDSIARDSISNSARWRSVAARPRDREDAIESW